MRSFSIIIVLSAPTSSVPVPQSPHLVIQLSSGSSLHSSPTQEGYFHFQHQQTSLFFFFFSSFLPPLQLLTLSSPAAPHSLRTSMALSWPANTNLEQPFLSSHFLCCSTAPHHSFLLSPATKFLPPNLFVFSPVSGSSHLCLS